MAMDREQDAGADFEALLAAVAGRRDLMAGSLSSAYLPCNKGHCKCTRGELHGPTWRLGYAREGRSTTVFVRQEDLQAVQAAVRRYAALREALLEAGRRELMAFVDRAEQRRRSNASRSGRGRPPKGPAETSETGSGTGGTGGTAGPRERDADAVRSRPGPGPGKRGGRAGR